LTVFGLSIAGAVVVGSLLGLDRLAGHVVRPAPRPLERTVPQLGVAHEDFVILSGDHALGAWLLQPSRAQSDEPLLLLAHGWGANYGTVLRLAEPLVHAGHEVLLFDVRGHGRNEPVPFVTVKHFRDDLMAATRYASRRFPDRQLVLVGHSMGGAAAVLAAAERAPVDALVLIAAPADILRVTAEFLTDRGLPGGLLVNVLRPFFWRRVGGSFLPLTPSRRIRELDLPILLIQPEHDTRVEREHARHLAEAAGIDMHLIRDREHTDVLSAPETLHLIEELLEKL
jgi:uncharacterized protein